MGGQLHGQEVSQGRAVFQLNIISEGGQISVDFDAVFNDGHGYAPEASGPAKVIDKNTLKFSFTDTSKNAGIGTIRRAGEDVVISIKPTRVADPRCVVFYGQEMRLKPARKK